MKLMNQVKRFGAKAAVVVASTAMPVAAFAADDLLATAGTELGGLKAGIIAFGVIVIGLAIALKTINIGTRAVNKA